MALAVEAPPLTAYHPLETMMIWTTPQYQDLRFGFEVTMYISAR
jgi:coenzyme PQQ precursor peptide PqqA